MFKRKPRQGAFALANARLERSHAASRRKMIEAAMAGGKSGFAVQMQMGAGYEPPLRTARPKER